MNNNNNNQTELIPWKFFTVDLLMRKSDGYIYISDILKKHNKTIDQWLMSNEYTKLLENYKKILNKGTINLCNSNLKKFSNNIIIENTNDISIDLLRKLITDVNITSNNTIEVFIHKFIVNDFLKWLDNSYCALEILVMEQMSGINIDLLKNLIEKYN